MQPTQPKVFTVDVDMSLNSIKNFKLHPITTQSRMALGNTLTWEHEGLTVYDKEQFKLFSWTGSDWNTEEPQGAIGTDITLIAGQNLSGGRLVYASGTNAFYFDAEGDNLPLGITVGAAMSGDPVAVRPNGIYADLGMGVTEDTYYYAGTNGTFLSNPVGLSRVVPIGVGVGPDRLLIRFGSIINTV